MPPPPLVQSTRAQRVVLAVVMAGLLLAALALVKTVTGAPITNPLGPTLTPTTAGNFALGYPNGWVQHRDFPGAWIDPLNPFRQLYIVRFDSPFDSLEIARDEYIRAVPGLQPTNPTPIRLGTNATADGQVLYGITAAKAEPPTPELLHFIAIVQHPDDPNLYLGLRIIDAYQPDQNRFATNAKLLNDILAGIRFVPPGS
ncbi:MAG: hypothetical protein AAGI68_16800 [Planctomycetota bacterium]